MNLCQQILIRMLWNRNMMLTDIMRASGSLLMTFWKIFDGRMKISWNFEMFSSGRRYYCEKSSEVIQRRFNNPLTTYFCLITFWWIFLILSSFSWILMFFLQKTIKKKYVYLFKIQENELRIENFHQNVMKPKYVVNGILKHHWVTSDDFSQ